MIRLPVDELNQSTSDTAVCRLMAKIRKEIKKLLKENEKIGVNNESLIICPTAETIFANYKYFLSIAKVKYFTLTSEQDKNKKENQNKNFFESINTIEDIVLERSGFCSPTDIVCIEFKKNSINIEKFNIDFGQTLGESFLLKLKKGEFIEELKSLHIEKWKEYYDNPNVLDGEQWELTFYCKSSVFSFSGSNEYPHNFKKFMQLIEEL